MTILDEDTAIIYGLDHPCRSLASLQVESLDYPAFVVGTQTLRHANQVCLLTFDDENSSVSRQTFNHASSGEICHISAHPEHADLIATCSSTVSTGASGSRIAPHCTVFRMPDIDRRTELQSQPTALETVSVLNSNEDSYSAIPCFAWQPAACNTNKAFMLADNKVCVLDSQTNRILTRYTAQGKVEPKLTRGAWNPHHNGQTIATCHDAVVLGYDVRAASETAPCWAIENAHVPVVRDLDFNPNRPYYIATCGDDCQTRFWDTRKLSSCLHSISQHSHWIWSCRFNPVHDQLMVTCSSDARVVLHCVASISSEAPGSNVATEEAGDSPPTTQPLTDSTIRALDEHEESVYAAEWSVADPWLFVSLSYDGRVIFSRVPRTVKYQILEM